MKVTARVRRLTVRVCVVLLLLLLGAAAGRVWFIFCDGVSHREIRTTVRSEGELTRAHIDERCSALERRIEASDRKLDRIEQKLDRILDLATPRLPDNMRPVE